MDSPVSPKDEIWFLRVCHNISNAVYPKFRHRLHDKPTTCAISPVHPLHTVQSSPSPAYSPVKSIPYISSILILSSYLRLGTPRSLFTPRFAAKAQQVPSRPTQLSSFNRPNTIFFFFLFLFFSSSSLFSFSFLSSFFSSSSLFFSSPPYSAFSSFSSSSSFLLLLFVFFFFLFLFSDGTTFQCWPSPP